LGGAWAWLFFRSNHYYSGIPFQQTEVPVYLLDKQTIFKFCLPLAVATGLMWLQNTGYRFIVGGFWGVKELGILVVGLGISSQLWSIIESLAMQFLGPYLYRHITNSKSDAQSGQALSDYINSLLPVYSVFAGFNAICGTTVLYVLTDVRYHVAAPFIIFGVLIEFARSTTNLWFQASQVKRQTKGVMLPYCLGAIIVCLGAMGTAHFKSGLTGLSIVLVIASIVTCGSMIVIMQRLLPIAIDIPRLMLGLGILAASMALSIISPFKPEGFYQNLVFLLFGGGITSLLVVALLWRSTALSKLLSTSLRSS
jgi:hypothetical protein